MEEGRGLEIVFPIPAASLTTCGTLGNVAFLSSGFAICNKGTVSTHLTVIRRSE